MTRTAWTQMLCKIKYLPDTHDLMLRECVCVGNTVVLRLNPRTCLPENALILPKKIKGHHSEVLSGSMGDLSLLLSRLCSWCRLNNVFLRIFFHNKCVHSKP